MQPTNTNTLQQNKFILSFARLPNIQFFCQVVSLPGVSIGEAIQNTPFVDLYAPGDKINYDYLTVTFLVDEDIKTWLEIHDWIRGMSFPEKFEEYKNLGKFARTAAETVQRPQYSDATLIIHNSKYQPKFRFKFVECWPTSLSPLLFNVTESPENPLTADVTFRFTLFNIENL